MRKKLNGNFKKSNKPIKKITFKINNNIVENFKTFKKNYSLGCRREVLGYCLRRNK